MKLFLLTLGVVSASFLALSLGALLAGKKLQGSCGGKALWCLFCKKRNECSDEIGEIKSPPV